MVRFFKMFRKGLIILIKSKFMFLTTNMATKMCHCQMFLKNFFIVKILVTEL